MTPRRDNQERGFAPMFEYQLSQDTALATTPADASFYRPNQTNLSNSSTHLVDSVDPQLNTFQSQFSPIMDLWSGNSGLDPSYLLDSRGTGMGMEPFLPQDGLQVVPSGNIPNQGRSGSAGQSRSESFRSSRSSRYNDSRPFPCEWKGCRNTTGFDRIECLRRHVLTQHISPRSFRCTQCTRIFNRRDNLRSHEQMVHAGRGDSR